MGIGRFVYTPILPLMVQGEGLSASEAGLIASSNYVGYLVGALAATSAGLGGAGRRWLLGALVASAATTVVMAWADGYGQFLAIRFVSGVASAWVMVFASALVLERLAAMGRGDLAAVHFGGVGVGIVLAALLTTLGAAGGGDWRAAWLCNGIVASILVAAVAYLVPTRGPPTGSTGTASAGEGHAFGRLLAAYALFGFGYVVTATFIVQLVRAADHSLAAEALIWGLVGLAAAPSVRAWNAIARRTGPRRAFSIACAVEAVGVGASVLTASLGGLIFAAVVLGGTFVSITALGLVEARARSGRDPRQALAMMTAAFGAGQIIGPALAGHLRDVTGSFLWPTLLAALALLLAAALVELRAAA